MRPHKASRRTIDRQRAAVWRAIEVEGQGVFRLAFFSPLTLATLAADALGGDAVASAQLSVIDQMLSTINASQSPRQGPACLLCGSPVWRHRWPARIGVMSAACDRPSQAIAHCICFDCELRHPTPEGFNAAILAFYRQHVMSDARMLPLPSPAGHA